MLYDLRLKCVTPWLGDVLDQDVYRFKRGDSEGWFAVDVGKWNWALKEANEALGFNADIGAIRFPRHFKKPRLDLLRKQNDGSRSAKLRLFEMVSKNYCLTFEIVIPTNSEFDHNRAPTPDQTKALFAYVGEHLGLSPWGSKFGYGRFEVEHLELIANSALLQRLRTKHNVISTEFYDQHRPYADQTFFEGHRLVDLSRQELLAIATSFLRNVSPDS